MRLRRRQVQWKADGPRKEILRTRELVHEEDLHPEREDARERLVPGSLWTLGTNVTFLQFDRRTSPPPLPYLIRARYHGVEAGFKAGTVAIYCGTTRVEEGGRSGQIVRILRHTFIIDGGRYMSTDLNMFDPA